MAGATVTFSVTATDSVPLTYQWFIVAGNLWNSPNADTNSTLILTNVQISDAAQYAVGVSDGSNYFFSDFATLAVDFAPQFTSSPGDQMVIAGTNVTLSVAATGCPAPSYQWQFNGTNILGATGSNLMLIDAQSPNQGIYSVVASNFLGAVTNVPMNLTVVESAPLLFPNLSDRVAIGHDCDSRRDHLRIQNPMTLYQWSENGTNIPGATNGTLVFADIQPSAAGTYSLSATNSRGHITSRVATLTVEDDPLPSTIVAWGDNTYGQTNLPTGETNVVALASGEYGTVFVRQDGTMGSFGYEILSPQAFATLAPVGTLSSEGAAAIALDQNGKPVTFGITYLAGASDVPATVSNAVAVAFGNPRLALLSDGTVVGWTPAPGFEQPDPANIMPSLPGLSGVRSIAILNNHCLILNSNGTVQAFGINGSGQSKVPSGLNHVVAIAAGASHSLALKSDGTVAAWGDNSYGQTNIPS